VDFVAGIRLEFDPKFRGGGRRKEEEGYLKEGSVGEGAP
jgi:hypothetical protein